MQLSHFRHIPCGESLPSGNPHAISMSLPTIADVIGYEEQNADVMLRLQAGYPRFMTNRFLKRALFHAGQVMDVPPHHELIAVSSSTTVCRLEELLNRRLNWLESDDLVFIDIESGSPHVGSVKMFLQHSGLIPSSRKAESYLLKHHLVQQEFAEPRVESQSAMQVIKKTLADAYGHAAMDDVILCNTGMTANYAVFSALKKLQHESNRNCFVQFGWLYTDTMEIMKKYSREHIAFLQVSDTKALEQWLQLHHATVAAIFTEVPNNPVMQFVDLPELSRIATKFNIPLVVDGTMGTPFNIELLSFADIAIESLTKFACGSSSLLMGGIVLRANSTWAQTCKELIHYYNEPPYYKEIEHLGACITGYHHRVEIIARNTLEFNQYISSCKQVTQVYSAHSSSSYANFCKIRQSEQSMPGVVSVVFDKPLSHYYDRLMLPKGPSLGNCFTLAMAYFYMAHWDVLKKDGGRQELLKLGLNPDLLRISIGMEPIDEIVGVFENLFNDSSY